MAVKKLSRLFISAIVVSFGLQSCRQNQELIEVQIPERSSFITKQSNYPDPAQVKTKQGPLEMTGLPYKYDELVDVVKPEALMMHYAKIHLNYANDLNSQIHNTPLEKDTITTIVRKLDGAVSQLQDKVGGYYNHLIYWHSLSKNVDSKPTDALNHAIVSSFGSMTELKKQLKSSARQLAGPGWIWLINTNGTLSVITTINNELPNTTKAINGDVLLAIDMWEHAYIQTHQDDVNAYLDSCINHLNWEYASKNFKPIIGETL